MKKFFAKFMIAAFVMGLVATTSSCGDDKKEEKTGEER